MLYDGNTVCQVIPRRNCYHGIETRCTIGIYLRAQGCWDESNTKQGRQRSSENWWPRNSPQWKTTRRELKLTVCEEILCDRRFKCDSQSCFRQTYSQGFVIEHMYQMRHRGEKRWDIWNNGEGNGWLTDNEAIIARSGRLQHHNHRRIIELRWSESNESQVTTRCYFSHWNHDNNFLSQSLISLLELSSSAETFNY